MKFRLTPLNIVTSFAFALLAISFFQVSPTGGSANFNMGSIYKILLSALILVAIVSDLIFRFTLKSLKRIWIIETLFIVFTVIFILILQK